MIDNEEVKLTGLGDYWSCLHPDSRFAGEKFSAQMGNYEVIGPPELAPPGCGVESAIHMVLWSPLLEAVMWLSPVSDGFELISHYPTVIEGCGELDAVFVSSTPWEPHIEGLVEIAVGERRITFFDVLFPVSRESYQYGESLHVSLSALALSVRRLGDISEHASGNDFAASTLGHVYETGETWFTNSRKPGGGPKDFYMLMGKLTAVERGVFGTLDLYRCRIELLPGVSIPVVFGQSSIPEAGWIPEAGSWVSMMAFLHGFRTGHGPKPRSKQDL